MSNLEETVEQLQREIQQLKDTQQANDAQNEENLNSVKCNVFDFLQYPSFLVVSGADGSLGNVYAMWIWFSRSWECSIKKCYEYFDQKCFGSL